MHELINWLPSQGRKEWLHDADIPKNNLEIRNDVWLDAKYQVQNVISASGLSYQLLQAKFIVSSYRLISWPYKLDRS